MPSVPTLNQRKYKSYLLLDNCKKPRSTAYFHKVSIIFRLIITVMYRTRSTIAAQSHKQGFHVLDFIGISHVIVFI